MHIIPPSSDVFQIRYQKTVRISSISELSKIYHSSKK